MLKHSFLVLSFYSLGLLFFHTISLGSLPEYSTVIWADFHASMCSTSIYSKSFAKKNPEWQLSKSLYDMHVLKNLEFQAEPRIPKIIHHIWLGSSFPEKYHALRDSWLKHNPGWEYKVWTDKDIEELDLINKEKYDNAQNYGEKSDIARYEILYRFGGLYIDTDFECIKSFDTLNHCFDFYAGLVHEKECIANNALIAARPGHPIMRICIEDIYTITNTSTDLLDRTGPYFFTRSINKYIKNNPDRVVLFPASYFYPWPSWSRFKKSRSEIEAWFRPETLAVHHWYCSWQ
jgi:mannosyltransferase OCH1-like enzyme